MNYAIRKFYWESVTTFPSYKDIESKTEYHALTRGLIINEIVRRIDPKGRTIGEIISEDFNIKGLYLGHSEDANSDPICGKMLNDSDLVVGFDDLPPFCLELKGMSMGQDLVTSFTTPDFVKGNTCKNNIHTWP